MLQWFLGFPEFTEFSDFNESSVPFRENPIKLSSLVAIRVFVSPFLYERIWKNRLQEKFNFFSFGLKITFLLSSSMWKGGKFLISSVLHLWTRPWTLNLELKEKVSNQLLTLQIFQGKKPHNDMYPHDSGSRFFEFCPFNWFYLPSSLK